jgi:hypothetical protein
VAHLLAVDLRNSDLRMGFEASLRDNGKLSIMGMPASYCSLEWV